MSGAKHSPGPWEAYGPTRGEGLTFTNEAHVGPGGGNEIGGPIAAVSGDDKEQALANARLIAAAPDLLDACEYVRRFLAEYDTDNDLHPSLRQKLDAAIRKAKQ